MIAGNRARGLAVGCWVGLSPDWQRRSVRLVCSLDNNSKLQQLMAKQTGAEFLKTIQLIMQCFEAFGCKTL